MEIETFIALIIAISGVLAIFFLLIVNFVYNTCNKVLPVFKHPPVPPRPKVPEWAVNYEQDFGKIEYTDLGPMHPLRPKRTHNTGGYYKINYTIR